MATLSRAFADRSAVDVPLAGADEAWQRRIDYCTWALLVLGIVARLWRYAMRFPLWGDEYALVANLLDRGYLDLLEPLNCHQVAPFLFLWAELSVVKLLGLSEYSLRLVPVAASILALVLFFGLARRLLKGAPLLFAVGAMAVAHYAIRHGAEAKPYAVDLCMSVLLLRLAVEAWTRPGQRRWTWALAAVAPLAVGFSYPAVFVAGGVAMALAVDLWQRKDLRGIPPLAAYGLTLGGSFLLFLWLAGSAQHAAEDAVMSDYWGDAFPPLARPWRLPLWLLTTHTGEMFAWPLGGERGGSTLTLVCFAAGIVWAVRNGRGWLALVCLAPFGLGLVAAAMERYPYGGHPRLVQYLGPMICLAAGLGGAVILGWVRSLRVRKAFAAAAVAVLLLVGLGIVVRTSVRPYKSPGDEAHRQFAKDLWQRLAREEQVLCVESQMGYDLHPRRLDDRWHGSYRCLRRMYDPRCPEQPDARVDPVAGRPLTCVLFHLGRKDQDVAAVESWLAAMDARYVLAGAEEQLIEQGNDNIVFRYETYRFQPRTGPYDPSSTTPAAVARRPRE
jgi:hypothetical protein